jgi:cathepsin L
MRAFQYLMGSSAELDSDYPYTAKDGKCKYSASKGKVKVYGYKNVAGNNTAMMSAINKQPIAVAINCSSLSFQSYSSGVLSGSCSKETNHIVVAVGYNSTATEPYWIVRNSWGTDWGNKGFIWMTQNGGSKGQCGINSYVNYPIV